MKEGKNQSITESINTFNIDYQDGKIKQKKKKRNCDEY